MLIDVKEISSRGQSKECEPLPVDGRGSAHETVMG